MLTLNCDTAKDSHDQSWFMCVCVCVSEDTQVQQVNRRRSSRKRKTMEEQEEDEEEEEDEDEVAEELIDRELDHSLETKSRQHNLTTVNVKNILHVSCHTC